MAKTILITGGPTNEPIDAVMKITNMSTGRLSIELTYNFLKNNYNVTLIGNKRLAINSLFEKYSLSNPHNVYGGTFKWIPVETTEDMRIALETESKNIYDEIIHCSAVGDYKVDKVFHMNDFLNYVEKEYLNNEKTDLHKIYEQYCTSNLIDNSSKMSSNDDDLVIKLGLTPKLISNLRKLFPNAKIIGFKLLENVSKDTIIDYAKKLCNKNDLNYVIANDLAKLRSGEHISHLVSKNGYQNKDFYTPFDIFMFVESLIRD